MSLMRTTAFPTQKDLVSTAGRDASTHPPLPRGETPSLADYGTHRWTEAMRGLGPQTMSPYLAGWRLRVVPTIGHVPVRALTRRTVNHALSCWIADECGLSTVKNSLAVLVRIIEQLVRDGVLDANPARMTGLQRVYQWAEKERDEPRSLSLPGPDALDRLADTLVRRSADGYQGWGDLVRFATWTGSRISEVSSLRVQDINLDAWTWQVRRTTVPGPHGLTDRVCTARRQRFVPLRAGIRDLVTSRLEAVRHDPMARLFTAPNGDRVTIAVLREATDWNDVVVELGHEFLRRHDVHHTGLTWMADAGLPVPTLRAVAGRLSVSAAERYLRPGLRQSRPTARGDRMPAAMTMYPYY